MLETTETCYHSYVYFECSPKEHEISVHTEKSSCVYDTEASNNLSEIGAAGSTCGE